MTTPALITMPRATVIIDFLVSIGWDITQETGFPLLPGPEILTVPDKAVFITATGGPGYMTEEGGADAWSFQARTRGPADDPLTAEAAAALLDWMILGGPYPANVDGVRVISCFRAGSPPSSLPLDPSDRRFEYTCNYIFVAGA